MRHNLKIDDTWFDDVLGGMKKSEIRRADRPFQVGDELLLYTHDRSRALLVDVTHVLMLDEVPGCDCPGFASISIAKKNELAGRQTVDQALGLGSYGN